MNFASRTELSMPLCDGRPPDGVCPDRKNDRSVCLSQDLMLCEGCEHDRFPDYSRKALKKKKAQSTASRQITAPATAVRSDSSDDTAGTTTAVTGGADISLKEDVGGDNAVASSVMVNGCINMDMDMSATVEKARGNKPEISEVLCFLSNKFHNYPLTMIKNAMLEFYREEEIFAAKLLLIQCISDKGLDVQQYTRNRIGPHKNKSTLDDICNIWSLIDESVGTISLPTFCAFDLSRIPVLCDDMSDIAMIKKSVMDLESQVKALSASLSVSRKSRSYDEMFPPMPSHAPACPSTVGANTDQAVMIDINSNSENNSQACHSQALFEADSEVNKYVQNYSDAVRHAPIDSDNEQFRTVTRKKKTNRKCVVGSCTSTNQFKGVPRKHVFCINRLQPGTSAESVTEYLQSKNVSVDSCYVVQSGGRRTADDESDNSDRREKYVTMRVCVLNVDVKKILAPDFWPISVTVRPWVFKSRQQQGNPRSNT